MSARTRRRVRTLLGSVGLGCVLMLIAAGPATAADPSGRASLVADDGGTSLFDPSVRLTPGTTLESCVSVAADGRSAAGSVHLWAEGVSGELAGYLQVSVDVGHGGGRRGCQGFSGGTVFRGTLADLAGSRAGGGIDSGWTPHGRDLRTFRFSVQVTEAAPQDRSAGAVFVWQNSWDEDSAEEPTAPPGEVGGPTSAPRPTSSTDPSTTPAPTPTRTPTTAQTAAPGNGPGAQRPTATSVPPSSTSTRSASSGSVPADPSGPAAAPRPDPATAGAVAGAPTAGQGLGPDEADVQLTTDWSGVLPAWAAEHVDVTQLAPTLRALAEHPAYPLAVLTAVAVFLAVQHHLDARDPKLALAPTYRTLLTFTDPRHPDLPGARPHPED